MGTDEVIALALLLGSDYTEGVKGVGIVNAMEVRISPSRDAAGSQGQGMDTGSLLKCIRGVVLRGVNGTSSPTRRSNVLPLLLRI